MRRLTPLVAGLVLLASRLALAHGPDRAASAPTLDRSHAPVALAEDTPTPALSLRLSGDAASGLELELVLERFSLKPPPAKGATTADSVARAVDPESRFAEGHASLSVNGEKIRRIDGPKVDLPGTLLRSGINQIAVSLDDHADREWTRGGRPVLATLFIDRSRGGVEVYRFETFPVSAAPTPPRPPVVSDARRVN